MYVLLKIVQQNNILMEVQAICIPAFLKSCPESMNIKVIVNSILLSVL
jgi:hypothetical protein